MEYIITGIYKITSPNNRVYIGQSVDIHERWKFYYKPSQTKKQPKVHRSFTKYGVENHVFEIIEECSIEQLDERETFWKLYYLEQVNNIWNQVLFCELHDAGGGPKSEETRRKMSISALGKTRTESHSLNISLGKIAFMSDIEKSRYFREIASKTHKGKIISPETRLKMSVANKGKVLSEETKLKISINSKGHKLSEESKIRIGNSNRGVTRHRSLESNKQLSNSLKKKIIQFDLSGNFIREWDGIKDASETLHINKSDISSNCRGVTKKSHGFIWKFK